MTTAMTEDELGSRVESTAPEERQEAYEGTSVRWKHFYTSFKLAAKKISLGWSYEDFAQCIPDWSSSNPDTAQVIYKQMSEHLEKAVIDKGEDILRFYRAAEGVDALNEVVTEARAAKAEGRDPGKDVWKRTPEPRNAVRARMMPVLEEEKKRLEALLAELETENEHLTDILKENNTKRSEQNALAHQWIDALEDVATSFSKIPEEEIQKWSIETEEMLS